MKPATAAGSNITPAAVGNRGRAGIDTSVPHRRSTSGCQAEPVATPIVSTLATAVEVTRIVETHQDVPVPLPCRRCPHLILSVVVALLLAACGGGSAEEPPPTEAGETSGQELAVAVASFDLATGEDQRLLAGLLTSEGELLGFGDVTFRLGYLGEEAGGEASLDTTVEASYLPVPGMTADEDVEVPDQPRVLETTQINGVYEAQVDFDQAGYWGLVVDAELEDGTRLQGQVTFEVHDEHRVPAVGEEAPRSTNLTMSDVEAGEVEPVVVDSRAQGEDPSIPDPELHATTVAEAIEAGRPAVVTVATPVYCASRFCGPLTNVLSEMADEYGDQASFIHLEVWEDFETKELNDAAAEWIQTETGGNEPWVFLVDETGTVTARWDNVLDVAELESELEELPATSASPAVG